MQEKSETQPQALANRPRLTEVQAYYAECFSEVSRDRRYTESGPLPLSTGEIRTYWSAFRMLDFEDFYSWIRRIDDIWLDEVAKKSKTK